MQPAPAIDETSAHGPVAEADLAQHLPRLHRIARRMLGCDHLAADAVQESLVTLWRQPIAPAQQPGQLPEQLLGWLIRTVVHRCQHLRRTAERRQHYEHIASCHCELHQGCDNPLHIAIAHETSEQLAAAVDTLPESQRVALLLYEQTGLDYEGIAKRLALPVGTVRSRLSRARTTVQAALRRHLSCE
jgi:RNA polymerase sigma factor (sigma-70 family)